MIKESKIYDLSDLRWFSSDISKPLDPIPNTPADNWGFDSDSNDINEDTILFNGGTKYRIAYTIRNILIDTKKPDLLSDKTSYISFKGLHGSYTQTELVYIKAWEIKLDIYDSIGISSENITFFNNNSKINDYISNLKLIQNGDIYTLSCLFTANPQGFTEISDINLSLALFDVNGNKFTFSNFKEFIFVPITLTEFIKSLQHLVLNFRDIYPENLCLGYQITGNCKLEAFNPNVTKNEYWSELTELFDVTYVFELLQDSAGYIIGDVEIEDDVAYRKLDGIDTSGTVFASVYLKIGDNEYDDLIKNYTIAYNQLGPFIKKCENIRDLYIPVPKYLADLKFNDFKEYLEYFFNTEYTSLNLNESCKIGILEKIKRIGDFNDASLIEDQLLSNFAKTYCPDLDLDLDTLNNVIDFFKDENDTLNYDPVSMLRSVYSKLAVINKYKGTNTAIYILFNTLGFLVKVYPLWIDKATHSHFYTEDMIDPTNYELSSHISLGLTSSQTARLVKLNQIAEPLIKLIRSIIPATRVLSNFEFVISATLTMNIIAHSLITSEADYYLRQTFYMDYSNLKLSVNKLFIPYFAQATKLEALSGSSIIENPTLNTKNLIYSALKSDFPFIFEMDNREVENHTVVGTVNRNYYRCVKINIKGTDIYEGYTHYILTLDRENMNKIANFLKIAKNGKRLVSLSFIFNRKCPKSVKSCYSNTETYKLEGY